MDERYRKGKLMAILPTILQPPPDHGENMQHIIAMITAMVSLPPSPDTDIRHRLFSEDTNSYQTRDVFVDFSSKRYQFYQITGETPETLLSLVNFISLNATREHILSSRNRILLCLIWLRSYPTYHMLATIFGVSVPTVKNENRTLLPSLHRTLSLYVQWPTMDEWRAMRRVWSKLPYALGAIDGTSHEIYRPETEPQEQYYSGHRCYHAIHTQIIIDVHGDIRYVESGFRGHTNNAQQFALMRQVGNDLLFPEQCYLLCDKIYPNRGSIMTPYTSAQIARKGREMRRKCLKLNRRMRKYRVLVEHAIGDLKCYRVIGSLWRHPRDLLASVVNTCASLVCRRKKLEINM